MRRVVVQHPAIFASLRDLYANVTTGRGRSKVAQIMAAKRKRKFIADFAYAARKTGPLVAGRAAVCYVWVIPHIDWDAPLKVLQDACQHLLFASGDDGSVRVACIALRRPDRGARQGATQRPALSPIIIAEAYSMESEIDEAIKRQALWTLWANARHAWIAPDCEPMWRSYDA